MCSPRPRDLAWQAAGGAACPPPRRWPRQCATWAASLQRRWRAGSATSWTRATRPTQVRMGLLPWPACPSAALALAVAQLRALSPPVLFPFAPCAAGLVASAQRLAACYKAQGVPMSRLLFRYVPRAPRHPSITAPHISLHPSLRPTDALHPSPSAVPQAARHSGRHQRCAGAGGSRAARPRLRGVQRGPGSGRSGGGRERDQPQRGPDTRLVPPQSQRHP